MVEKYVIIIHYLIFKISTLCKAHFCFVYIFTRLVDSSFQCFRYLCCYCFPLVITNDITDIFGTIFSGSAPSPSQLSTQLPLANTCLFLCNSATSLIAVLSTVFLLCNWSTYIVHSVWRECHHPIMNRVLSYFLAKFGL